MKITKSLHLFAWPATLMVFCFIFIKVNEGTMIDKIVELEKIARKLESGMEERNDILKQTTDYVNAFLENIHQVKAYVRGDCPQLKSLELSESGQPFSKLLHIVAQELNHAGINGASGSHLGYIPGGGLWASSIGDMLAAVGNRNAGVFFSGQGAVIMENQMVRWLCSLVGYPDTAHGFLSSGGSMATLAAVTAARDSRAIRSGNVEQAVIYFTSQAHHCIQKALHITGLHESIHRIVPMNDRFQMDVAALEKQVLEDKQAGLHPFLVLAAAGTTNTGSVDPLDPIADVCEQHNMWFHVDAAYGGFFLLVDEMKERLNGIERSDSLVMDPHKGLFLPFGTGVALVRNGKQLIASHSYHAVYLTEAEDHDEISPSHCSPELTRHFRGLRMWLPLHLYGLQTFRACLEEKIYLARYFHEKIQQLGFETGNDPELTVSIFRYPAEHANDFNQRLVRALQDDGRAFFSSTTIEGTLWIRCAILHFRTHLCEIDNALLMIRETVERMKMLVD